MLVTGRFGVFVAGTLEAHLYDRGGAERDIVSVGEVTPRELIKLQKSVQAADGIVRLSLHLVDKRHIDYGTLGEVFITDSEGKE